MDTVLFSGWQLISSFAIGFLACYLLGSLLVFLSRSKQQKKTFTTQPDILSDEQWRYLAFIKHLVETGAITDHL